MEDETGWDLAEVNNEIKASRVKLYLNSGCSELHTVSVELLVSGLVHFRDIQNLLTNVSFLLASDNLELNREICDDEATREFESLLMKISPNDPIVLKPIL
ncbi:hypothetical protein ACTXT7_008550 [Hymenolepis weldensis]